MVAKKTEKETTCTAHYTVLCLNLLLHTVPYCYDSYSTYNEVYTQLIALPRCTYNALLM